MVIGNFDTARHVLIVAEIGNNHEGNFDAARKLVRMAAECGADAVKFQTFRAEQYVSRLDDSRFKRLKSFELSYPQFAELAALAHSLRLLFISTPFDLESAAFLENIVDAYKVASGDNNFYPLLEKIARTGKPMIVSTGLSDAEQVNETVGFIRKQWEKSSVAGQLALLHCVSSYPVPPDQVNLLSIRFQQETFACTVGFSDHTVGNEAAVLAVALGAQIVEKHFTLVKNFSTFRDHQLSADPPEMNDLVRRIHNASSMLGVQGKTIQPCEQEAVSAMRRSVIAGRDLPAGHSVSMVDLAWVRPGGGLPPGAEGILIGRKLKRRATAGEKLSRIDVD